MARWGWYAQILEDLAAAYRRAPTWLQELADHSVISDRGGALPFSIATPSGDYAIVWTGGTDAVTVAVSGSGTGAVSDPVARDDGTSYVLVTGAVSGDSIDVSGGTSPPASALAYSAADGAKRTYLVDAIDAANNPIAAQVPGILIDSPDIGWQQSEDQGLEGQAVVDCWLLFPKGSHAEADFLDAGSRASLIMREVWDQAADDLDLLAVELAESQQRAPFRGDELSDRKDVIWCPLLWRIEGKV